MRNQDLFTTYSDTDWLGKYPKQFFDTNYQKRSNYNAKDAKAVKSYYLLDDGTDEVSKRSRYKHGLTYSLITALADNLTQIIFPDLMWLSLKSDNPKTSGDIDKIHALVWHHLTNKLALQNKSWNILRDAVLTHGVLVRVYYKREFDYFKNKWTQYPSFQVFPFDDYVFESGGSDKENATVCMRYCLSKAQLKDLANSGVFDQDAVNQVIDKKSQHDKSDSYLSGVISEIKGETENSDCNYWIYELLGNPYHPSDDLPYNQLISSCNDVCLRAINNPTPRAMSPCIEFALPVGAEGGLVGSSLGWFISEIEGRINRLMGWVTLTVAQNAHPPLLVDSRLLMNFSEQDFQISPGRVLPVDGSLSIGSTTPLIDTLRTNGDIQAVYQYINNLEGRAMEMSGVSKPVASGQLPANTPATVASLQAQGAQSRINSYARHFQYLFSELVRKLFVLMMEEFDADEAVRLLGDEGFALVTPELIKNADVSIDVDGISDLRVSQSRTQQFVQTVGFAMSNPAFANEIDARKMLEEYFANTAGGRSMANRVMKPPAPPMPPQVPMAPNMAGQNGQPPDAPPQDPLAQLQNPPRNFSQIPPSPIEQQTQQGGIVR